MIPKLLGGQRMKTLSVLIDSFPNYVFTCNYRVKLPEQINLESYNPDKALALSIYFNLFYCAHSETP